MKRAYKFRFYPTSEQASELNRTFGCARLVWNKALAHRHAVYTTEKKSISYVQMDKVLNNEWKKSDDLAFLREVSSVPLQQTLRHQQAAFNNFFAKRARYPRFKSRHGRQSIEYTRNGFRWDGTLRLAKIAAPLDLRLSRPTPDGQPSTVTVSRDAANRWHVSMLFDDTVEPLPLTRAVVGLDLGLKSFLVTSDGDSIDPPQFLRRKEARLARYQRRMARCRKGSRNRDKARIRVARNHARVADARRDFLHKISTDIVRAYDVIAVEDLHVNSMVRNHCLAKSISDSGWGEFRSMLTYKVDWYGKRLVVVDRFYPSSKTCSSCGYLLPSLNLGTRQWTCPACGTRHDRDINAAKNILAAGLAVALRGEACGADVSLQGSSLQRSAVSQEPMSSGGVP